MAAARRKTPKRTTTSERPFFQAKQAGTAPAQTIRALAHKLHVNQIELERQNEELRRVQKELRVAHDRYEQLYDFLPAGHLTLNRRGIIQEANLRASLLLGVPRGNLIRRSLMRFFAPTEWTAFTQHCKNVFLTGARQSCDLPVLPSDGPPLMLHIESRAFPDRTGALNSCRMAFFNITEQKERDTVHDRLTMSWRVLLDSTREGICGIDLKWPVDLHQQSRGSDGGIEA